MPRTLFTIGYQGRSARGLCEALSAAGVKQLIDVRARAWSHRPEFRKTALKTELERHGIEYVHCKDAGNPFRPKPGETLNWKRCQTLYRKHLDSNPDVVDELTALVGSKPTALFCYEAATTDCHRGELVKALKNAKHTVRIVNL
jgi:uncharacterized protein (DUF488 family)